MYEEVLETIIECLTLDSNTTITKDTKIKDIGMSSLEFIKFIVKIEKIFSIEYPDEQLYFNDETDVKCIINTVISCIKVS